METFVENNLFLYDLPKENITIMSIAFAIKQFANYDVKEMPIITRNAKKSFCTAKVRINDTKKKFLEVAKAMKYFEINGKQCRALPYLKQNVPQEYINLFVKNLDKNMTSSQLDQNFQRILGADYVASAKVSINSNYTSRGFGIISFYNREGASLAIEKAQKGVFNFEVQPYLSKDIMIQRKKYDIICITNFPPDWSEETIKKIFSQYGNIKRIIIKYEKIESADSKSPYAFVRYEDPQSKDYSFKCASEALTHENGNNYCGYKLIINQSYLKTQIEQQKQEDLKRYQNTNQNCYLNVKGFPENTTEEQFRAFFEKYGEIESIELDYKDGSDIYSILCYKSPISAFNAQQKVMNYYVDGKQFFDFYKPNLALMLLQELNSDRKDLKSIEKQSPSPNFNIVEILKRPETFDVLVYFMIIIKRQQENQT
eukprot:403335560